MKCIILVGGYATRMYPLTLNTPKALLNIKGKTILDNILENIMSSSNNIDEYIIVTNDTFYDNFTEWKNKKEFKAKINIISDGSTCEEDKVGAVSALIKIINEFSINDDMFVLAGDNILDFSLDYIFDDFNIQNNSFVMYHEQLDKAKLSKTGVAQIDNDGKIISMEEKPKNPKSNYAIPPFYWLKKKDIKHVLDLFDSSKKIDSMGQIILNLCNCTDVYAKKMNGNRYDIGSKEEYYNMNNIEVME